VRVDDIGVGGYVEDSDGIDAGVGCGGRLAVVGAEPSGVTGFAVVIAGFDPPTSAELLVSDR